MTNPPTPPYTEATVELVADALRAHCAFCRGLSNACPGHANDATSALNALVKAGLLLPEGAETRTGWDTSRVWWYHEPCRWASGPEDANAPRWWVRCPGCGSGEGAWLQLAPVSTEGDGRFGTGADESSLLASSNVPDPRAETEDGGAQ